MKTAMLRLLSSMKFWTTIVGAIVTASSAALAKYGFDLSDDTVNKIATWLATGFSVLLGGQALADHGKSKAEIENRNVQSGLSRLELLFMLTGTFCLAAAISSCASLKSESKKFADNVVDCTTPHALDLVKQFGPAMDSVLTSAMSDTGKLDWSSVKAATSNFATNTGGCVLAAAIERLKAPRGQDSQASPLAVDVTALDAGWTALRREQFGGKTFALGVGS